MNRLASPPPAHRRRAALLAVALLIAGKPLAAEIEVTALVAGDEALDSTLEVTVSRYADFSVEPMVSVGTELAPGDLMTSVSGQVDVELVCGSDTVLQFSGAFRVVINPPGETDCAVNFLAGELDVVTDEPTQVTTGGVTLGSEATRYEIGLERGTGEVDETVWVWEGEVELNVGGEVERVGRGMSWRRSRAGLKVAAIEPQMYTAKAARLARLDTARAAKAGQVSDRELSKIELQQLHYSVLVDPDDGDKRLALANKQLAGGERAARRANYHLQRANRISSDSVAALKKVPATQKSPSLVLQKSPLAVESPYELIRAGRHQEALPLLEKLLEEKRSSRVYCALAATHVKLGSEEAAIIRAYARRGLRLHATDSELSESELESCRSLGH